MYYERPYETNLLKYEHWTLVFRPSRIPVFTTPQQYAADPWTGLFSLSYHGKNPKVTGAFVQRALALKEANVDDNYYVMGRRLAPQAVRKIMEAYMSNAKSGEPDVDYLDQDLRMAIGDAVVEKYLTQGKAEGKAEGEAKARIEEERDKVLLVLDVRGLEVSVEQRMRIKASSDLAELKGWTTAARTATATGDIFR